MPYSYGKVPDAVADVESSDPATGQQGEMYYNTSTSELRIHVDGNWVSIAAGSNDPSGGLDNLLMTDGSNLVLTSGTDDVLLLT